MSELASSSTFVLVFYSLVTDVNRFLLPCPAPNNSCPSCVHVEWILLHLLCVCVCVCVCPYAIVQATRTTSTTTRHQTRSRPTTRSRARLPQASSSRQCRKSRARTAQSARHIPLRGQKARADRAAARQRLLCVRVAVSHSAEETERPPRRRPNGRHP